MKKIVFVFLLLCGVGYAEFYKVFITREAQDLYKTTEGIYIKTRYCLEYAYGDEAILKYEGYGYSDKLIFENGSTCDVERILR
ncbi:hypothetical protein F7P74_06250 [Helicobacter pullorum NCTC 12824]|uniref:hypothetical protein n=1 Tax=Helicobacter pullorum TaxID=35818 RepID=UPI0006BAFB46|nr:hypothetical protein [Helicobacter pullorum]KAB0574532.1 hypothetical protein F7P74_06250 [Helicobacter pullorum NCTC 12824]